MVSTRKANRARLDDGDFEDDGEFVPSYFYQKINRKFLNVLENKAQALVMAVERDFEDFLSLRLDRYHQWLMSDDDIDVDRIGRIVDACFDDSSPNYNSLTDFLHMADDNNRALVVSTYLETTGFKHREVLLAILNLHAWHWFCEEPFDWTSPAFV